MPQHNNNNHMQPNHPFNQRLPPNGPPNGYWYSVSFTVLECCSNFAILYQFQQPPHHWMMHTYPRNRRASFYDSQTLPSSLHFGRNLGHHEKHKMVCTVIYAFAWKILFLKCHKLCFKNFFLSS